MTDLDELMILTVHLLDRINQELDAANRLLNDPAPNVWRVQERIRAAKSLIADAVVELRQEDRTK